MHLNTKCVLNKFCISTMCEVERDRNKNSFALSGKNLTNANAMSNSRLRKNEWIENMIFSIIFQIQREGSIW